MENTEIQLFSNTFDVSQLTSQETRENLYLSINQLDENKLTDIEIRQSFQGIKIALGVFIKAFVEVEGEIKNIRLIQAANEAKMEKLFIKGQMEIQELKQELGQMQAADRHLEKVVEVRKEKKIEAVKIAKEKSDYVYKLNDRVRIIDSNSVGTIDKIDKKNVTINYGVFTTKTSLNKIELVEKAKK